MDVANPALTELWCGFNQLTALDLSENTSLKNLYCEGNLLTSLDVTNNTLLISLSCTNNKLTSLYLPNNPNLRFIYISQNQISGVAMDALIESLPSGGFHQMNVIWNENEGNVMTTTQVAAAKAKEWTVCYFDGEQWQEYTGSDPNGIKSVVRARKDREIYNLSGQRITRPRKGMNIIDGRKVMMQ